jgi:hypothetical protein
MRVDALPRDGARMRRDQAKVTHTCRIAASASLYLVTTGI